MIKYFSAFLLFTLFFSVNSYSQNGIIRGKVTSDRSATLSQILISFKNPVSSYTAISDLNGNYSVSLPSSLPADQYTVTVSHINFDKYIFSGLKINENDTIVFNIVLTDKSYITDEIEVIDLKRQSQEDLRTSVKNLSPGEVKVLPGAIEDVFRSLRSQAGVTSPNDFSSQLVVRGSGPDQNLIIMDDIEVFNPYRLYGLVSMFNPETLRDITLITGGFPAKYGDRLSAVLDVSNKEGIKTKGFSMINNVTIANYNIIVNGKNPFNIPGSYLISTRRTYYDLIIGPIAKNAGLISEDSAFPNFRDLQFKFAFGPFKKSKIILNGIISRDGVDIIPGKDRTSPDSVVVNDVTHNNVAGIAWHFFPTSTFLSKTTFSWYKNTGDNNFDGDILDPLIDREGLTPSQRDSLRQIGALLGFQFKSQYDFRKFSLTNKSTLLSGKNAFEFGGGIDLIKTDLTYTLDLDELFKAYIRSFPNASALLDDFSIEGKDNLRAGLYGQGRFRLTNKLNFQPSARVDYYSFLKKMYISPRLSLGFAADPLTTIRTSAGLYYQSPGYEKLIDSQTFYDFSKSDGSELKSEKAVHFVLGIDRWLNNTTQLKFEGYYKIFSDLIVQQKLKGHRYEYYIEDPTNTDPVYVGDPANYIRSADKVEFDSATTTPVNGGKGTSYGFEFSLEKKYSPESRFSGWINYSLSFSDRTSNGITKPFRFDQRHSVNIVGSYKVNSWLEVGARWTYSTNFPFTPPVGVTPRIRNDSLVINPFTQQVVFNLNYGGDANRLTDIKPAYHRLDVRVSAYTKFWNVDWIFYLDVINVYNRKNILQYKYTLNSDFQIIRTTTGMIPILPTIGINARF
ncbi:hypothetical protein BH10BAC5_BH10BAC5_00180 [soil metagenome]